MFEKLALIDNVRLNFSEGGLLYMNVTLAFIMFGVAMDIKKENFVAMVQNPKSALLGIFSQIVLLPALTFLLVIMLNPPPSIAMGMILIAACPGGNISNFISALAKANVALSVSLTAFSTLSATLVTPINFAFWGGMYVDYYQKARHLNIPIEIDFLQMAQTVFILLGIPLMLGMWVGHKYPAFVDKYRKKIRVASIFLYMTFIVGALVANAKFIDDIIIPLGIVVMLLNAQTLFTGYLTGTLFKVSRADRRTLAIETGIQNSGLALVLIFNPKLFNANGGMAFMAAWWGIWQMVTGIGLALILAKMRLPMVAEERVSAD
ncbi:MAG: bile acid:sodium symporter family protein [Bacteroidetes bacterium]|nr:bile acid:sodium symporter family protein [Bacteroidota bacterium]